MSFRTEQEVFWATEFGNAYTDRNLDNFVCGNIALFSTIIHRTRFVESVIEFGANVGNNLKAIRTLLPSCECSAIELNQRACQNLEKENFKVYSQSILDFQPDYKRDLAFIKGVMIHLHPDVLQDVYQKLYDSSNRYILIAEYYNPSPVAITYRGHQDRLFKRDFAGEFLDKFPNVHLIDYGFCYHRDNNFSQDDITWFLMEKKECLLQQETQ